MALSETQRRILTAAAQHPHDLAEPPEKLPSAACAAVGKAMLKADLVIAVHRPDYEARALWAIDGDSMLLRITDAGLRAIGLDPATCATGADTAAPAGAPQADPAPAAEAAQVAHLVEDLALLDEALATPPARRVSLRDTAAAVLAVWEDEANREADIIGALDGPMQALRAVLAGKPARAPREPGAPRKPREGTKQQQVLAMLRRPEGTTVAQIAEATGWAPHTVRGFFAGLKKRQGIEVSVLERVRQVGPNKEGAKGSYTVYHIAE
ncbi:DUF3489 domain-containing protein [Roseomonas sp. NAR14]|uniref:DUF3489 domain-containing protein n=1 Tax=Roseomonas acroporae TaxID=2937791 RepID=A0A9X1YBA4_9PROT|nr:DUF3489 domain-containing protein [Roseomonas acroporae]MCK8787254.1 DUF3489 domain-containing protein [Roseomonas acroporae]